MFLSLGTRLQLLAEPSDHGVAGGTGIAHLVKQRWRSLLQHTRLKTLFDVGILSEDDVHA